MDSSEPLKRGKGCYNNLLVDLIQTDIPGYQNFVRMPPPCSFHLIEERIHQGIAMRKPKKSENEFYNYNGFFSMVLLALVDTEYRFQWVDIGSSGSLSDAQMFNHYKLKKMIVYDTLDERGSSFGPFYAW